MLVRCYSHTNLYRIITIQKCLKHMMLIDNGMQIIMTNIMVTPCIMPFQSEMIDNIAHYWIQGLRREWGSSRRRPFPTRWSLRREEALGESHTLTPHRWSVLRRELHWILSAKMRREASLALTEGPLTVTAHPSVSGGSHSFAESQISASRWRWALRREPNILLSAKWGGGSSPRALPSALGEGLYPHSGWVPPSPRAVDFVLGEEFFLFFLFFHGLVAPTASHPKESVSWRGPVECCRPIIWCRR
jgi:hypothetical protein